VEDVGVVDPADHLRPGHVPSGRGGPPGPRCTRNPAGRL